MMLRIKQFLAMAGLTALEAIRQPICLLLTAGCIVSIAAVPLTIMHLFGEDGKQARDSAFAIHFVFGLLMAGHAAGTLLSGEIRSGTASAVLSKPVSRELFFLSKFAGITAVILVFSASATVATLLSERVAEKFYFIPTLNGYVLDSQTGMMLFFSPFLACICAGIINYRFKRPFASSAFGMVILLLLVVLFISGFFERNGKWMPYSLRLDSRIIAVSFLISTALVLLSAIAITISTRFDIIPTMILCSVIFMFGLMTDYLLGRHVAESWVCGFFYTLIPNWQNFWVADALSGGGHVPWAYVLNAGLYAVVYTVGVLCLGMLSFRHTEVK